MKKKLIVLCGALVVAVAAVSITVASRDVSPFSGMTKASVEALTQIEFPDEGQPWWTFWTPRYLTAHCGRSYYEGIYLVHEFYEKELTFCDSGPGYCIEDSDC